MSGFANQNSPAAKCDAISGTLAPLSIESIVAPENVKRAWGRVRRNRGAGGVDHITIREVGEDFDSAWWPIRRQLLEGSWKPRPLRLVEIPKPDHRIRSLAIPTVLDRVVHQCVAQIMVPWWEPTFHPASFGYRPGRSTHNAVLFFLAHLNCLQDKPGYVLHLDIENFFDSVPWSVVEERVSSLPVSSEFGSLIQKLISSPLCSEGVVHSRTAGLAQGSPLSPLLANAVLHPLDLKLSALNIPFTRYADDIVVAVSGADCDQSMSEAQELVETWLQETGLRLNRSKCVLTSPEKSTVLGYSFQAPVPGSDKLRPVVSDENLADCRDHIAELTQPGTQISMEVAAAEVTRFLVGWENFAKLTTDTSQIVAMYTEARRQLRRFQWEALHTDSLRFEFLMENEVPVPLVSAALETSNGTPDAIDAAMAKALPAGAFSEWNLHRTANNFDEPSTKSALARVVDYSGRALRRIPVKGRTLRLPSSVGTIRLAESIPWLTQKLLRSRLIRFRLEFRKRRGSPLPRVSAVRVFLGRQEFTFHL